MTTGMGQALNFALSINDKLPPGSDLGGKAFAAILGLQSINMARSGINDIKMSPTDTRSIIERSRASNGLDAPPAPSSGQSIRIANPGNPQAVEQQRQAVVGQLQEHVNGISNTTDAGGAPRDYSPASSTNGASGLPPVTEADQQGGAAALPPLFGSGTATTNTGDVTISPDRTQAIAPDGSTAPVDTNRPLPTAPALTQPDPPPVGMGAGPDLAVLANYRPQAAGQPAGTLIGAGEHAPPPAPPLTLTDQMTGMPPQQPQIQVPEQQPIQADPNGGGMPLAALKQRLAMTPPWRLSSSDFALAQQYGLEEDAWKTPTRVGMAV
jgi:hypothetical protein